MDTNLKKQKWDSLNNVTGLKIKLIITFSAIFATVFIVISIASYSISKSILTKNINLQTEEFVQSSAYEINNWILSLITIIDTFPKLIKELPKDKDITPNLLKIYEFDNIFSSIYYATASGKVIRSKPWTPYAGYDPTTRPWYITAVKEKKTSISPVYVDTQSNNLAFSISTPVFNENKTLRGVFSADILLKTLEEKLDKIKLNGMGFAVLIDNSGVVLAHNDKSVIGKNLLEDQKYGLLLKDMLAKEDGKLYYNIEPDRLLIFTKIISSGWVYGIVLIKKEMYSELQVLTIQFFIIFLISFIIVVLTARYFTKRLTQFTDALEKTIELNTTELQQKIALVEYLSLTDPLTEVANRRKVELTLKSEIDRTHRTGKPLSVIMIDIDHFKSFNDNYGHDVGDKVLKKFAETINRSIRVTDLVGRIGGEEFLIICPETDVSQAKVLAEKLRLEVETIKLKSIDKITASFGCAQFLSGENSFDSLLSRSDKALYKAKDNGRNRVEVYS